MESPSARVDQLFAPTGPHPHHSSSDLSRFLRSSGLRLLTVGIGRFAGMLMRDGRICRYARGLLATNEAEAMDAFHYALMRRCRIDLAVSSDNDWSAFPYGVLITAG